MAQWKRDTIAQDIAEHLDQIEREGVTTGEEQLVHFTPEFQQRYGVAPIGTLTQYYDECDGKLTWHYKAGPLYYDNNDKPIDYGIPSIKDWVEKYNEGKDPGNLYNRIPDEINPKLGVGMNARMVRTQNKIEQWIFERLTHVTMIDPSNGSMWRACEKGVHVNVIFTTEDPEWQERVSETFSEEFAKRKLRLEFGNQPRDHPVYHGSNGFKHLKFRNSFCLEPNPHSQDLRTDQSIIEAKEEGLQIYYDRKDQKRGYFFPDKPNYIRVDPVTLNKEMSSRGDAFFLAMNFDPSTWSLKMSEAPQYSLARVYHVLKFPKTSLVKYRDYNYSVHEGVVYDVDINATYMSKYQWMKRNCPPGCEVVDIHKGYGKWIIHPYAKSPRNSSFAYRDGSWIIDDYSMYNYVCPETAKPYYIKAVVFCPGNYEGEKVTPLEKLGTWFPVPTYVENGNPRFYVKPDRKGYYFPSLSVLQRWVLFILHNENLEVPSGVSKEIEGVEPSVEDFIENEDELIQEGLLTSDAPKSLVMNDVLAMLMEPKTQQELSSAYPLVPWADIRSLLFRTPGVVFKQGCYQLGQGEYDNYDSSSDGLEGTMTQTQLKRDILGGMVFEDDISYDVTDRVQDAEAWGYTVQVVETWEEDARIVRKFCYTAQAMS